MKVKSAVKAGGIHRNHGEKLVRGRARAAARATLRDLAPIAQKGGAFPEPGKIECPS